MRIALIADAGSGDRARELAAALTAAGAAAELMEGSGAAEGPKTARLAAALVELEAALEAQPPDAAVLVGAGDEALAGALVATKLGIATYFLEPSDPAGGSRDARLLALLAGRTLGPDAAAAARELVAQLGPPRAS